MKSNKINKQTPKKVIGCQDDSDDGCNAITFKQQCQILKEINDDRYLNFFYFCCCTGVRVCEALSIKTSDIDKKNKVIKIKMLDSKTKKHKRSIPYLPELFEKMDLSGKYLFNDITDDGSKQYFYKLYKELNLDLTRHSTRHTFVSICQHIGIDSEQIQQWAGHTDLKMTTDTYTHTLTKGTSPILIYLRKLKKQTKPTPIPAEEKKQTKPTPIPAEKKKSVKSSPATVKKKKKKSSLKAAKKSKNKPKTSK